VRADGLLYLLTDEDADALATGGGEPRARMATKKAARTAQSSAAKTRRVQLVTTAGTVDLRWTGDKTARVQQLAMEWSHIVRNRSRWVTAADRAIDQDVHAQKLLAELGIDEETRRMLASVSLVRVGVPWTTEEHGWESRVMPWEFALSAGTRDLRKGPLAVTRWLERAGHAGALRHGKVLFVESAPGRLAEDWTFDDERKLVESYAGAKAFVPLVSPTRKELQSQVRSMQPDVVHLAGFDTHQGLVLAGQSPSPDTVDGYLLGSSAGIDAVSAEDLATLLTSARKPPYLVFCNIWNSAARVAPLIVAAGAGCAVGFQDTVDDAMAEIFAGNFYRGLSASPRVDAAFDAAWTAVRSQRKQLRGTGIVLWRGGPAEELKASVKATVAVAVPPPSVTTSPGPAKPVSADEARAWVTVTVEPEPNITYALLHNNRNLFRDFRLHKLTDARAIDVQVFVNLHTDGGGYPFQQSYTVDGPVKDVVSDIRVALTSNLARTLDEVLRTSLYVEVKCGGHQVYSRTFPVTLNPVDQWTDTDADRAFLPSFVFPRDRAVGLILKQAEQYVTALRDDPGAGFDGYQALDEELENPALNVDRQVQALWYSVLYKVPASYINPPPTYAVASQRIRTPSEVIAGGFGTCIDLALMFAACLEAVEIYSVMFLLRDHAFPGYWRTDAARAAFRSRVERAQPRAGAESSTQTGAPWSVDASALAEIRRAIDQHQLVPLETVGLTGRWSLSDAIEEATAYFADEDNFLSMLDIQTAREAQAPVTPLPLGVRLQQG
jgi:hypothetical protein